MAFAETANLAVKLTLGGNFNSQLAKTRSSLRGFDKDASRAYKAGGQIGTGIKRGAYIAAGGVAFLAAQLALGLDSLVKLESATAQTEAVIKSTGAVAGVSAVQVRKLAESYEAINATVGDELIQNAENLLLTFTNVKSKAFEPALAAALDMNQALGKGPDGLASTVQLLGKALNDPEKGLARLERATGKFDDQTREAIQTALKNNDVLGAQTIILGALEKKYGGSFAKAGGTTAGRVAKFTDSIEDLQRALATALLPTVSKVADKLSSFLSDPKVIAEVTKLGDGIASLFSDSNIAEGGRILADVFDAAKAAAPVLGAAARTMATVVSTAVKAFTSLPKEIQALAIGGFAVNKLTGGLVTNIAGGIFGALKAMTVQAGVVNVTGGIVNGGGGLPGGGPGVGLKGAGLLASIGLTTATLLPLTVGLIAAAGLSVLLDNAINEKGGLPKVGEDLTKNGLTLGTGAAVLDPSKPKGQNTFLGGKGSNLVLVGAKVTIPAPKAANVTGSAIPSLTGSPIPRDPKLVAAIAAASAEASRKAAEIRAANIAAASATRDTASAVRSSTGSIVGALGRIQRPITNVNIKVSVTAAHVQRSIAIQQRYGPAGGSSAKAAGVKG